MALLNAATALLELGQISLASMYCERLLAIEPSATEAMFARGLVRRQMDDLEGAKNDMLAVVRDAPNHPRANLLLADILTELGDAVGAAECAAAHAKFYGDGGQ